MTFNRKIWLNWKTRKPCPNCETGVLIPQTKKGLMKFETSYSKEMNSYGGFNYTEYIFAINLKCSNCNEIIVVSGKMVEENYPEDEREEIQRNIIPISFIPAPKIISIPKSCPKSISKLLNSSFELYWLDISSCANKIRISIEVLLTELKVNKTKIVNSKRKNLTLHERILLYQHVNHEVVDYLLAIKWIGNAGSHFTDITKENILDAYELLEYSLEILYNDKKKKLVKMSKEINKKKKPIKKNN